MVRTMTIKLILENWRKYLNEEEQNIYSFDFDNTLIRYHTLEDGDVEYIGPHEENIQLAKNLAAAGNKVIIVTSRAKPSGPKKPWDDSPLPEELIAEFDLPIDEIYYTFGDFKADKLVELGVTKHWDDDEEEVAAAEAAGVEAVLVPVEEGITERLRSKWVTMLALEQSEVDPKMKKYLEDHPYMEPDGLQERCQKGYKTHPKRKTKKMYGKTYRNCIKADEAKDPKTGTGKKPKGSGRRLYTDEDPSDTVSVKFRTVQDVKDTLSKKSFKAKSHKRQSQIINLIHQRVRAAHSNAKDPKTKARLKKVLDYAEKRKEASKQKTKRLQKSKTN